MSNKILVTGGEGLIGSAIKRLCPNETFISSTVYDLTDPHDVDDMFYEHRPNQVIHLAGKVGGVGINLKEPVEFFEQNSLINTLVLKYAHKYDVKQVLSCMSTCVFPDVVEYPLQPSKIHLGEPHFSNFGYAYAKRMLEVQTRAYQIEYGRRWFTVIPTNVYGPNDNYNLVSSHVIPALIHKCYLAKKNDTPWVIWGSGKTIREFIYVDDVATLMVGLLNQYQNVDPIIISSPTQYSILDVVNLIADKMNFAGEIVFEADKPEGQYRKPSDITPLLTQFPTFQYTPMDVGMVMSIDWFVNNYDIARK